MGYVTVIKWDRNEKKKYSTDTDISSRFTVLTNGLSGN